MRLMIIFIGRVNRTRYDLSLFRTDEVVAPANLKLQNAWPLYLHGGCALNNEVYNCFDKGCPNKV